ncbi:hypothetical protein M3J09_006153 [Ascochyta lentis]
MTPTTPMPSTTTTFTVAQHRRRLDTGHGATTSTSASRAKRPGWTRDRTGCLTCRRRKKKCNLQTPVCSHCYRLNYCCEWEPPRTVSASTAVRPASPASPTAIATSSPTATVIASPRATVIASPRATVIASPPASPSRSTAIESASPPLTPSPMLQLQPPLALDASPAPPPQPHQLSLTRHVVRYYVQHFTDLLSATRDNNCFLSVFLPMAFEYSLLYQTVVAWAAAHLAMRTPSPALHLFTLESHAKALSMLSLSLSEPTHMRESELACCLVLCSMDSIVGDTAGGHLHLQAAADILRPALVDTNHAMHHFLTTFDGRWLLRNFAYHDALMSVTMDRAPLIGTYHWRDARDMIVADSYFGFASTLIFQISAISSLNAAVQSATIGDEEFSRQVQLFETDLLAWTCPDPSDASLAALADMYRSAALLHLYRVIYRRKPQLKQACHARIQRQADAIVDQMRNLPAGSAPECTTLFPIFMCGAETDREHHQRKIRERLQSIMVSRSFKNIENAISVLDELWHRRSLVPACDDSICSLGDLLSTEHIDWLDILRERDWKLSLS